MTWLACSCPRLGKAQLAELSLLVARIPASQQREWCKAAVGTMTGMELDSPFRWLQRVLNNALTDGKAPGSNGNGHGSAAGIEDTNQRMIAALRRQKAAQGPPVNDAAALKAYYTPAGYEGIVES
jgi:hypothetical protein